MGEYYDFGGLSMNVKSDEERKSKVLKSPLERQGVCQAETVHRGKRSALYVRIYFQLDYRHSHN